MSKLTLLHQKCLGNMPMVLDAVSNTVNGLNDILDIVYGDLESRLEKSRPFAKTYTISLEGWKRGVIYAFGDENDYKRRWLAELRPALQIQYLSCFSQNKKRNPRKFELEFGYMCEEEQHVLYFQLFETSDKVEVLTDEFCEKLKGEVLQEWDCGKLDNSIYIQFTVDETITETKIHRCKDDFWKYILDPVLNRL